MNSIATDFTGLDEYGQSAKMREKASLYKEEPLLQ